MPQAIPEGLTRDHVLQALADLDAGISHPFGDPTGYELIHNGKRYPPKPVIGLANRHLASHLLRPRHFSGGEAPGQANSVLRRLGFDVVRKYPTVVSASQHAIDQEHDRRMGIWSALLQAGGPAGALPSLLRELRIHRGAQGIWLDKVHTGDITPGGEGITVGVLHTGQPYADDPAEDCILYHYPSTKRPPGRDAAEVEATKAAGRFGLPFFVIMYPAPHSATRNVCLGWVEAWDDESRTFLISFDERPPTHDLTVPADEVPFRLVDDQPRQRHQALTRPGQQRFKFRVLQRYGSRCVACDLKVIALLEAAHIRPKKAKGSDDPRNGLVFCPTHHRAFDHGLSLSSQTPSAFSSGNLGLELTSLRLRAPRLPIFRIDPTQMPYVGTGLHG
jgi:hypothetical protein